LDHWGVPGAEPPARLRFTPPLSGEGRRGRGPGLLRQAQDSSTPPSLPLQRGGEDSRIAMARYEHLLIYKTAMDLTVYLEQVVRNFSRYQKYTIGSDPRQQSRELMTR